MPSAYIPSKIWLNIITFQEPPSPILGDYYAFIKPLSLVSASLRDIVQPSIFKALRFVSNDDDAQRLKRTLRRLKSLVDWMKQRPAVAGWVQQILLSGLQGDCMDAAGNTNFRQHFMAFFGCLTKLRVFNVLGVSITMALYVQLYRCPRLRSFNYTFWGAEGDPRSAGIQDNGDNVELPVDDLTLEELYVKGPMGTSHAARLFASLALAPKLKKLEAHAADPSHSLTSLYKAPQLFSRPSFQRLSSLTLEGRLDLEIDALYGFLASCDKVTKLELWHRGSVDSSVLLGAANKPTARNILPRLQSYTGPFAFARMLVPGRPVENVDVGFLWDTALPLATEELEALSLGAVTMRQLKIRHPRMEQGRSINIATLFPHLEKLELQTTGSQEFKPAFLQHVLKDIGSFSNLEALSLTSEGISSTRPSRKVDEAVQAFLLEATVTNPALKVFEFQKYPHFWWRDDDGQWKQKDQEREW